jgi:hypothetical protein
MKEVSMYGDKPNPFPSLGPLAATIILAISALSLPVSAADTDGDGLLDEEEMLLGTDPNSRDSDVDAIDDYTEVWAEGGGVSAPADTDDDGIINALDPDDDGDSVPTLVEGIGDADADGKPDYLDDDDDGDGVPTIYEDPDGDGDPTKDDTDGDTLPNYLDADDDNDEVYTVQEDLNHRNSARDDDTDGDGIPNYLDADDDGDGVPTALEFKDDSDGDGLMDYLESSTLDTDSDGLANQYDADDDGDGRPTSQEDVNHNGTWFDDDSDADGIPDFLDYSFYCPYVIVGDLSGDCKVNMVDLALLASNWLLDCTLEPENPGCVPL